MPVQADEGVCNDVECCRDEPDDLVRRSLMGTDFEAVYCERHDPLDDPVIADLWEAV